MIDTSRISFPPLTCIWTIACTSAAPTYPQPCYGASMNNKNVGVIGLGAMGLGIARSLLRSGFNVHASDVREKPSRSSSPVKGALPAARLSRWPPRAM